MNIRELAKALGLSTSTVSRALNGYQDVNAQTRQRVQDMANALGYRPDAGARRLVRGRADAIGIVYSAAVDNLGNPQFLEMASGLSDRLEQDHLDLLLAVAQHEGEWSMVERLFRGGRVDAVIVPNTFVQDERVEQLLEKGYPFVAYGRTSTHADYSWFDFDNERGSHLAVNHLLGLGHRRFAYVHAPLELNFASQRHVGFLAALRAAGLDCPLSYQVSGVNDRRGGLGAVARLLALEAPPTAIVVDNNLGGVGVIRGLMDAGIRVGADVSVVVHGDIPSDTLLPGMHVTTVSQATPYQSGQTMGDMLVRVLKHPEAGPYQVLRQPALIIGTSSSLCRN
ncbi:LacI family DNA-binding transcriptional regulator [Rhodoferax aquaticus]|uniref:LacI family transcriptional regulator n=1 Tax=Rhodoferax aquaticus TaxID=2527691 RepID=A0A515ETN5_9BURK|nr:substrate-binding domain-containing protein [Rhodoferax aquaticus]QDL55988.1 LacI family transcriptional regulator [Rhodoferax aquaticus]